MSNRNRHPKHCNDDTYDIVVNGRKKEVSERILTYLQIVQLAYPGENPTDLIVFTVTYSTPKGKDGSATEGDKVRIKDGIIFNVRKTDKS